jgi:hypothetical protein
MIAHPESKGVRWMLLAVFALAPTVVLAQQNNAPQDRNQPEAAQVQSQAEKAPAQPEDAQAQPEDAAVKKDEEGKLKSVNGSKALGMSILGNQEAPKALVIVPWKRSELGNVPGISTLLDDSKQPIDKEVFMRMLSYYEIRSETAHSTSAPTDKNTAQPPAAAQRRK